jgi:hypothetical protein
MTLSKYERKFTDHLAEIESKINSNPEYKEILEDAREKFQKSTPVWMVPEDVPIEHLVINDRVQRSFILKHAVNTLIDKFDPRLSSLPICIKKSLTHYEIDDGQHNSTSRCLVTGHKTIRCLVIDTNDKFFPTRLYKVYNRTGSVRASDFSIWKNDVFDYQEALKDPKATYCQEILSDPDFQNAYNVKLASDHAGIEIVDKPRKDTGHYFSHIKGIVDHVAKVGPKVMGEILMAYKKVWCVPLSERKVDNGMIFGMAELYLEASNRRAKYLDTYPDDWMEIVYDTLKGKLGDAANIHHGTQQQTHNRLGSWNVDAHMPTAIRDLWQWCASAELKAQIDLPYDKNISESLRIWPRSRAKLVETLNVITYETVS